MTLAARDISALAEDEDVEVGGCSGLAAGRGGQPSRPASSVAMPRKLRKPTTSVTVVKKIDDD